MKAATYVLGLILAISGSGCRSEPPDKTTGTPVGPKTKSAGKTPAGSGSVEALRAELRSARRKARLTAYVLHMNQLQQAVQKNDIRRGEKLLNRYVPGKGEDDLRGFEWHFWKRKLSGELWSVPASRASAVAVSTDGKTVAAPSTRYEDSEIRKNGKVVGATRKSIGSLSLIDAGTGRIKITLKDHPGGCDCIRFSPDGSMLASIASGEKIGIFNASTGKPAGSLAGHREGTLAFEFLPDGKTLVSTDYSRTLRFWNWKKQTLLHSLTLPNHGSCLAVSRDGKRLAIACGLRDLIERDAKYALLIFDTTARKQVLDVPLTREQIPESMDFMPDGKLLMLFAEGNVALRNVSDGKIGRTWSFNSKEMIHVARLSPDGKHLLTGSRPDVVLWDMETGRPVRRFQGHKFMVGAVAFTSDGKRFITAGMSAVKMWQIDQPKNPRSMASPQEMSGAANAISPTGKLVVTGGGKVGRAGVWNADTRGIEASLGNRSLNAVAFSPDENYLAMAGHKGLEFWDVKQRKVAAIIALDANWYRGLRYSPKGNRLAVGVDKEILVFDAKKHKQTGTLRGHQRSVAGLAFTPDGNTLASIGFDNTVRLWNLTTMKQKTVVTRNASERSVAFVDGGKKLVWMDANRNLIVWDLEGNVRTFLVNQGNHRFGDELAISPDGKTAAVDIPFSSGVTLFNVSVGEPVVFFKLPEKSRFLSYLQFSPNGKTLTAVCYDGSIHIWRTGGGE